MRLSYNLLVVRTLGIVFILFFGLSFAKAADRVSDKASDIDEGLADLLKIEINHNSNRLKNYKNDAADNKVFENEREKGLDEFYESQERWDLLRDRGLREYLKQQKAGSPSEGTPDHRQYLKEKTESERDYMQSQKVHVKTRDKILNQQKQDTTRMELEELQLLSKRPRYEFRKRGKNKWVGYSSKQSPGTSTGISAPNTSYQNNSPQVGDYSPAPAPYEGFDEIPPPPPVYDTSVPYDPSFGGEMIPPPPPPPDYDF